MPNEASAAIIFKPPPSLGLIQGLVGYWSFDGPDMAQGTNNIVALDKSGQGNNGTLKNTATSSVRVPGKIGQALDFDGSDDFISTGYGASPIISSLTVSFWFKTAANNTTVKDAVGNADIPGNIDSLNAIFNGGGVLDRISCFIRDADGDNLNIQDNTGNFYDDEWHHYVCVFAGTNGFLYLDGQQSASATNALVGDLDFDQNFYIGARNTGGSAGQYFDDLIDEVRIYNRALSSDEIKRLYRSGATLKINKTIETDSLSSGLVGHWTFDGTDMAQGTNNTFALDKSGQANNGKLKNTATSTVRVLGKIGQALDFDGSNDHVNVGSNTSLDNLGPLTISAWIKADIAQDDVRIYETGVIGQNNEGYGFKFVTNGAISFDVDVNNPNLTAISSVNSVAIGKWEHVLVTWDGSLNASGIHLYVNGKETTYQTQTNGGGGTFDDSPNDKLIGFKNNGTSADAFDGKIDDVRIYNRVLSSSEIERLYRIGSTFVINKSLPPVSGTTLQTGLVGHWSFDGPDMAQGTNNIVALDKSGQGNNGKLKNTATSSVRVPGKIGQALDFDGSNDYIATTYAPNFASGDSFSFSFWFRSDGGSGQFIGALAESGARDEQVNSSIGLFCSAGQIGFRARDTDSANNDLLCSGGTFGNNAWHHVVDVFDGDGGSMRLYVDGVSEGSTAITANSSGGKDFSSNPFYIGAVNERNTVVADHVKSLIDNVRIYNRALSLDEIKQLYQLGF